jgi:hypothetical protein
MLVRYRLTDSVSSIKTAAETGKCAGAGEIVADLVRRSLQDHG